MASVASRRRRRQLQGSPQILLRPAVVTACQLPFILGYRSRDKALEIRADPAFPRPIRQLGPKSRAVWLLNEVEDYLARKAAEGRA